MLGDQIIKVVSYERQSCKLEKHQKSFFGIKGKFWFSSYGPKCCQPIKLQDSLKCNISKKK